MKRKIEIILLLFTLCFVTILSAGAQDRAKATSLRNLLNKAEKDTTRISLLLELAEFQIFKPGEFKTDLDSAAGFIVKAKQINAKVRSAAVDGAITLTESYMVKERGQWVQGKALAEKAVQILSKGTDKFRLGRANLELAVYYDYTNPNQLPEKTRLIEKAIELFHQSRHQLNEIDASINLAALHMVQGKLEQTEKTLLTVINESKVTGYKNLQFPNDLLAEVYYRMGDQPKELQYRLKALEYTEASKSESLDKYWRYLSLAQLYELLGQYEKELYWVNKILYTNKASVGDQLYYSAVMFGLNALVRQGKFIEAGDYLKKYRYNVSKSNFAGIYFNQAMGNYFSALKQYSTAETYFLKSVDFYDREDKQHQKKYLYAQEAYTVGHFYICAKLFTKAGHYLRQIENYPKEIVAPVQKSKIQFELFQVDSAAGNYLSAIKHYRMHQNINDSLFSVTKSRQLNEMQVKYETKQKEQQLKSVNSRFQMEQTKVQKANMQRNLTLIGILMLLVIAALAYNGYRLKKKSNRIILKSNRVISHKNEQLQRVVNEKEWLLKEVHHRVKNNLHTVICLLESQANYLKGDALEAIENSQHRIYAMSLIHQKLYQSEDIKTIEMSDYLPEFIRYLGESFDTRSKVRFNMEINPLKLSLAQAIPLSLIINEAITNSIKYAFSENKAGLITVRLQRDYEKIELVIADNGVGMDPDLPHTSSGSLGLKLMKGLSEDIGASIKFEVEQGTKITMIFNLNPLINGDSLLTTLAEGELS